MFIDYGLTKMTNSIQKEKEKRNVIATRLQKKINMQIQFISQVNKYKKNKIHTTWNYLLYNS